MVALTNEIGYHLYWLQRTGGCPVSKGEAVLSQLRAFENMVRTGKDLFLRSSNGRVPKRLPSGEDVSELCSIATKVGLPANYETIRIIGDFCAITNPVGERLFLDSRYQDVYPEPAIAGVCAA